MLKRYPGQGVGEGVGLSSKQLKNVTGAKFKKITKSKRTNYCFYYSC